MRLKIMDFLIASLIFLSSCVFNNEISTYNDLAENKKEGNLQIVTVDTTVYYADSYNYNDSSISIVGYKTKSDVRSNYIGDLFFKDIAYIQTKEPYFFPSLAYFGLNLIIIGKGYSMITAGTGIQPVIKIVYPGGGGGSCPYIYSWNGQSFSLEGEAFGAALGKSLETKTSIILQDLKPNKKGLKVKITNERPETHFFDQVQFFAIETNERAHVFADNKNSFKAVKTKKKLSRAFTRKQEDISELIMNNDDIYWCSDLSSANSKFDFEDQIFIILNVPGNTDSLSLIISAINTEIMTAVFSYLQKILGDDFVNFTKALETDREINSVLRNSLLRSSLKIDIWNGKKWEFVDLIYPEANQVKFHKLVRLPAILSNNNNIKIRFRTLCDVWKIDAVHFDDNQPQNIVLYLQEPSSYNIDCHESIDLLKEADEKYIKLLPGQSINLEYSPFNSDRKKDVTYGITIRGYLYEWIIDKSETSLQEYANLETNTKKIQLVKKILSNMDFMLPMIYNNWENLKNSHAFKN